MFGNFLKTTRRGTKRYSAELNYGTLENKRLLAGNVMVNNAAQLFIRGDSADNQIEVIGNEDGTLSVIGKDGTTVNGSSDPLVISENTGDFENFLAFENGLRAHMGAGNDKIFVQGIEFDDTSIIYGGLGDDIVSVFRSSFADRLVVQTFSGDDTIALDESTVEGKLRIAGLDGRDTIGLSDAKVVGDSIVVGGNGSDQINIGMNSEYPGLVGTTETNGNFVALGGAGDDTISFENVQNEGFLGAFAGDGDDEVFVITNGSDDLGQIRIGGQGGEDVYRAPEEVMVGTFEDVSVNENDRAFYNNLLVSGARVPTMFEFVWWNGATEGNDELNTLTFNNVMYSTDFDNYEFTEGDDLTLFVPTNEAFEKLGDALNGLTDQQVRDILSFHFANGATFASELVASDSVDTLLGSSFSVEVDNDGVLLNENVTLSKTDIRVKNGVVHAVNEVLIPNA